MKGYATIPAADLLKRYDVSEFGLVGIAMEQTTRGHAADAVSLLNMTTAAFPRSHNAYLALGDAYRKLSDEPRAVAAYRKSLELNPKTTDGEKRDADRAEKAIAGPERK